LARIRITFVSVDLAEAARETRGANTGEAGHAINTTSAILTGVGSAFVDVGLTEESRETSSANAGEIIHGINACGTILTRA
jgi:hypothetical protein